MASVLHCWYVNNFRQRVGDNTGHVGTGFPLAKKIGFAIDSWFVARSVDKSVLDTRYANSGRKEHLIASYVNLVCIAVIHDDIASRNSNRLRPTDDLAHDLRRGAAGWSSRGINLDADYVGRLDKPGPRRTQRALAGQVLHPLLDHAAPRWVAKRGSAQYISDPTVPPFGPETI